MVHVATGDTSAAAKDGLTLRLAALGTAEQAASSPPRREATPLPRRRTNADLASLLLRIAEQFRRLRVSLATEA